MAPRTVWSTVRYGARPALTVLAAALGLAGCAAEPVFLTVQEKVFGYSVEGRPIRGTVLAVEDLAAPADADGRDVETVLLFGGIHGDEPLGVSLLRRFIETIRVHPELATGRRLIVVPAVNPDGLARRRRTNAQAVDLNRNFPSASWTSRGGEHGIRPGSEPETSVLIRLVERYRPDRILSVHSPLHCVNYDGPARELAELMARASRYEVKASVGYPTPGSFGSWAGAGRGIPVITLELRRGLREPELWSEIGEAVLTFVQFPERRVAQRAPGRRAGATVGRGE